MRITVVGSGGWGTALALVLEENGHDVTLWSHRPEKAEELKRTRENPMLKGVRLPESLHLTADLNAAGESDVVVMVTPSYAVRETAAKLRGIVKPGTVIVSASKSGEVPCACPRSLTRSWAEAARWWCCPAPPTRRRWAAISPPAWWRRRSVWSMRSWSRICL